MNNLPWLDIFVYTINFIKTDKVLMFNILCPACIHITTDNPELLIMFRNKGNDIDTGNFYLLQDEKNGHKVYSFGDTTVMIDCTVLMIKLRSSVIHSSQKSLIKRY